MYRHENGISGDEVMSAKRHHPAIPQRCIGSDSTGNGRFPPPCPDALALSRERAKSLPSAPEQRTGLEPLQGRGSPSCRGHLLRAHGGRPENPDVGLCHGRPDSRNQTPEL